MCALYPREVISPNQETPPMLIVDAVYCWAVTCLPSNHKSRLYRAVQPQGPVVLKGPLLGQQGSPDSLFATNLHLHLHIRRRHRQAEHSRSPPIPKHIPICTFALPSLVLQIRWNRGEEGVRGRCARAVNRISSTRPPAPKHMYPRTRIAEEYLIRRMRP